MNAPISFYQMHSPVSDDAGYASGNWLCDRRFAIGDLEMKWLALGALSMSSSPADSAFWALVSDSCSFYDEI